MNNEFKKITQDNVTRYVLESDGGTTSSSSIASDSSAGFKKGLLLTPEGNKKTNPPKTRNPVAKNASAAIGGGAAGAHKDKKKAAKQGQEKHKKPYMESLQAQLNQLKSNVAEGKEDKIEQLKQDYATAVHWSKNETSPQKREAARRKAETIKAHLEKQYKQGVAEGDHEGMYSPEAIKMGNHFIKEFNLIDDMDQQLAIEIVDNCLDGGLTDPNQIRKQVIKYLKQSGTVIQSRKQGVAEGFNGEYDDEAGMAQSNLLTTARAVMGLLKTIKDRDNLPEWGQEKIAKAEMMLVSVWDYLQSQKAMGNDPQQGVAEGLGDSGFNAMMGKITDPAARESLLPVEIQKVVQFLKGSIESLIEVLKSDPDFQPNDVRNSTDLRDMRKNLKSVMVDSDPKNVANAIFNYETEWRETMNEWAEEALGIELFTKLQNLYYGEYGEGVAEGEKKGLYYYVNKRKKAGTSRDASSPKAPSAQSWKDAAKTAKKESMAGDDGISKGDETKFHSKLDRLVHNTFGKRKSEQGVAEGAKVDRQAKHITASMMKKGKSKKDAESIAWAHIKHPKSESADSYFKSLTNKLAEKLDPNAPVDDWVQDFAQANPEKYHQFRQNNRPGTRKSEKKIERMAQAASYAAKTGK